MYIAPPVSAQRLSSLYAQFIFLISFHFLQPLQGLNQPPFVPIKLWNTSLNLIRFQTFPFSLRGPAQLSGSTKVLRRQPGTINLIVRSFYQVSICTSSIQYIHLGNNVKQNSNSLTRFATFPPMPYFANAVSKNVGVLVSKLVTNHVTSQFN